MSPAEELRKAALTLRETAAKATRGPWCCYPTVGRDLELDEGNAYTVSRGYCDREDGNCEPDCGADVIHTGGMGCQEDTLKADDAAWITVAHPGLGEPLARWLDLYVGAYEVGTIDLPGTVQALAVARVINGGAQ